MKICMFVLALLVVARCSVRCFGDDATTCVGTGVLLLCEAGLAVAVLAAMVWA